MAVKQTGQLSLAEAFLGQKLAGGSSSLDRLSGLVKWYRFEKLLNPLRDGGPGRAAWPPLVLFKALLLQSLYGLSDRELEEALGIGCRSDALSDLALRRAFPITRCCRAFATCLWAKD
jgi:IS5 family transposase